MKRKLNKAKVVTIRWCSCSVSDTSVMVFFWPSLPPTYLGEEWSSFSYNLLKLSSENWLTFIYLRFFLMFQCKKGTYYGQLWLWSPLIFVLFDLCPNTKGHSLNIRTTEAFSSLKIGRNICAWGACGFYHITEGFSSGSSVWTPDISSQ